VSTECAKRHFNNVVSSQEDHYFFSSNQLMFHFQGRYCKVAMEIQLRKMDNVDASKRVKY